jgi:hypothetical protein
MKRISVLVVVIAAVALTMGCGSSPAASQAQQAAPPAPDWLEEIAPEDAFWGIGQAKLQNESLAMETAESRARRAAAMQISVMVQGMLTDYAKESGLAQNSRSIQSIERIGRDLVDMNVSGAIPNARKRMPDGTWWVRVSVKKADAQRSIGAIVNNEMADFAEFKADQALRMLDSQLGKNQSKPMINETD